MTPKQPHPSLAVKFVARIMLPYPPTIPTPELHIVVDADGNHYAWDTRFPYRPMMKEHVKKPLVMGTPISLPVYALTALPIQGAPHDNTEQ